MSDQRYTDSQIYDLMDKALCGVIEKPQLSVLNSHLRESPEWRKKYRMLAGLHVDLTAVVRLNRARQLVYQEIRDRASITPSVAKAASETGKASDSLAIKSASGPASSRSEVELPSTISTESQRGHFPRFGSSWRTLWLAVAATLVVGVLLIQGPGQLELQTADRTSKAAVDDPQASVRDSHQDIIAYFTAVEDVAWKGEARPFERHDALRPGDKISLESGEVGVEFVDGARVTLAGPAEFVVLNEWSADLHSGRLSANVPPWAVGFTVNAPHFRAVDRGTSFTLAVDEGQSSGALVLDGVVDIDRPNTPQNSKEKGYTRLRKGDGIWVDQNKVSVDSNLHTLRAIAKRAPEIPRIAGDLVANYRNDYQVGSEGTPTSAPGWRYLCNSESLFGDTSGYRDLIWDGALRYDFDGVGTHPGPFPYRYLGLRFDGGHPGCGVRQKDGGEHDLFVIAAYSVPRDSQYRLDSAWLKASDWKRWAASRSQEIEVAVHVNDQETTHRDTIGEDGFVNFNCELGKLNAGDVIYVGVGPYGDASLDSFDWNFSVVAELP